MIKYFWIPIVIIYFFVGLVLLIKNIHDYDSIDDSPFCQVWVAVWTLILLIFTFISFGSFIYSLRG